MGRQPLPVGRIVPRMPDHAKRIEIARQLFAGVELGRPRRSEPFMTPDAVLNDVASGRFEGWPAIRAFFAKGLAKWDDLVLAPDEFWVNDDGLALHYLMSATVKDAAMFGEEHVGKKWEVEVMSFLRFDGESATRPTSTPPAPATAPSESRSASADSQAAEGGYQIRRCSGMASPPASSGVSSQRAVHAAGEAPAVGRAHDHVLVVAAVHHRRGSCEGRV